MKPERPYSGPTRSLSSAEPSATSDRRHALPSRPPDRPTTNPRGSPLIVIRPAGGSDGPTLLAIWRSAVEATHHFLTPADIDWYEPQVATYLQSAPDARVAVLTEDAAEGPDDGTAVGFTAHDAGAIQMLFVAQGAQGVGVGSALLEAVRADVMGPDGPGELTVDVNEDNLSGRRFYASRGFTVVSRSPLDDQGRAFPLLHLRSGG